jgi:cytochrome d ubiquinol oxidase subunit I
MLGMATIMAALVAPTQLVIGHMHGENTMHHQPAKVAAMEGNWDHREGAPLYLFGWPDEKSEKTKYGITIDGGASWVLTGDSNGKIPALKDFPKEDRPPVAWVFWSFRVMVGIGLLMIAIGAVSAVQYFRGQLFKSKWLHGWWMVMMPSGFIALLAGWFVTEIGRQPWTAYGIIRTSESVSPAILGGQVAWSLLAFVVMYILVFGAGSYYILKLIGKGIPTAKDKEQYYKHGIEASVIEAASPKGGKNV